MTLPNAVTSAEPGQLAGRCPTAQLGSRWLCLGCSVPRLQHAAASQPHGVKLIPHVFKTKPQPSLSCSMSSTGKTHHSTCFRLLHFDMNSVLLASVRSKASVMLRCRVRRDFARTYQYTASFLSAGATSSATSLTQVVFDGFGRGTPFLIPFISDKVIS